MGCSKSQDSSDEAGSTFVGDQVDYKIIGIDPGAGLMKATAKVIEEYGLENWELVEGSGTAMAAALQKAYDAKEPIIVTGWTPHWKFAKFDLKYLEDPKGIYGAEEEINTIVRKGLKDDAPSAYQFLDNFNWTPDDMAKVMVDIQSGTKEADAAAKWVSENEDKVNQWIEGITPVSGETITLAYVAWDSEIASTNVVKYVLENKLGYKVEMMQVEAGPMWAGVANGDADAMVAAWLPTTHADYYEKFKGQFEDLGPNLKGTKIGLVVPAYMDINSIEDLKKK
ncbi:glycine/betaine ABC transporter [Microaerobacter geothermalis]|uniref:glycine betaine ABC transporter substrate-binding protein n=1 Tax=Microaerobacter geothermalis TaxID=674972 RepID=UPI001F41331C|nr:glycine betaine ABC transporter substrate-binding protein [Microaerobacter geothermalis]MCF6092909.1 glycine/betaine ABC transporter [Microaerobacter geothermalis]